MTNLELVLSGTGTLNDQVYQSIRAAILAVRIPGGSRLPSSRSLARSLEVSRMTTVTAYERLAAEGFVETRPGAGTFVMIQTTSPASVRLPRDDSPRLSGMAKRLDNMTFPVSDLNRQDAVVDFGYSRIMPRGSLVLNG